MLYALTAICTVNSDTIPGGTSGPVSRHRVGTAAQLARGWQSDAILHLRMSLDTLPGWAGELLATERVARLAYLDEADRPRVLPVTFAVAGGAVWSAIDEKPKRSAEPARLRYLKRRPEAALLVDVYDDDWTRLAWVQLRGSVEVVPIAGSPEAMKALAAKYAPYAERTPPGPLLRLSVEGALHWRAAG